MKSVAGIPNLGNTVKAMEVLDQLGSYFLRCSLKGAIQQSCVSWNVRLMVMRPARDRSSRQEWPGEAEGMQGGSEMHSP